MNAAVRRWIPALAPGLVLVLIAVQVLLGVRGFHLPRSGLVGALELPGRLLGWGGVALLLPLFGWLLVGMWGYSVTSMALKMLGAVTLGLSVGALCALGGGEAVGGRIGAPLADLLSQSLGSVVAGIVLVLMAAPGVLLATARFQLGPAAKRETLTLSAPTFAPTKAEVFKPSAAGAPKDPVARARGWYPQRRFDAQGNELPMEFGNAKDVGGIRYRDEEPRAGDQAPAPAAPPPVARDEAPEPAPQWPKGLVHDEVGDEPPEPPPAPPTRAAVPNAADRLRPGSARPATGKERGPDEAAPEGPKKVFARSLFPKNPGDPNLIPGVRYRDEPEPAPAPEPPPAPPPPPPAPPPAVAEPPPRRAAAPTSSLAARTPPKAAPTPPPEPTAPTPEPTRRRAKSPAATPPPAAPPAPAPAPAAPLADDAVIPFGAQANNARYQSKLAASGIFDETAPAPAAPPQAPPPRAPQAGPEAPATAGPEAARKAPPAARKTSKRAAKPAVPAEADEPLLAQQPAPPPPPPAGKKQGAWVQELGDAVFVKAVEASLERGAASAVLLTRRLGLGYGKAQALIERLAKTGVLGEVSPTGARPVLITREDLDSALR